MTLRELLEALTYPEFLGDEILEKNIEPREILDRPVILNDGLREYEVVSIYTHEVDSVIYVDIEEVVDDAAAG